MGTTQLLSVPFALFALLALPALVLLALYRKLSQFYSAQLRLRSTVICAAKNTVLLALAFVTCAICTTCATCAMYATCTTRPTRPRRTGKGRD